MKRPKRKIKNKNEHTKNVGPSQNGGFCYRAFWNLFLNFLHTRVSQPRPTQQSQSLIESIDSLLLKREILKWGFSWFMISAEEVSYCLNREEKTCKEQVQSMTKIILTKPDFFKTDLTLISLSLIWVDTAPFIEWCCLWSFMIAAAMLSKKSQFLNSSFQTNQTHKRKWCWSTPSTNTSDNNSTINVERHFK